MIGFECFKGICFVTIATLFIPLTVAGMIGYISLVYTINAKYLR